MPSKSLNSLFKYKIKYAHRYGNREKSIIQANVSGNKNDWRKKCFRELKNRLRQNYYLKQKKRCAFCRLELNIDAYFNHIEHIVARSIKPKWIFEPKNLVIACTACNQLKNDSVTLDANYVVANFPNHSRCFLVLNPHFDKWEDHLRIKDGMFITAKPNSKGQITISKYHLYRYHLPIEYSKLLSLRKTQTKKALTQKLYDKSTSKKEVAELKKALRHLMN